jgi:phage terminase large subunit-like protein
VDGHFYLLRCVRAKKGPAAIREFIQQEYRLGKDLGWWDLPMSVWTEKTGLYAQEVAGLMLELAEIPWKTTLPRGTKEARSISLEYMLETGRFYCVTGTGDWIDESRQGERDGLLDEMDAFPAGLFDDRVDAVCQLISVCQRKYGLVGTEPEKAPKREAFGTFKIKR